MANPEHLEILKKGVEEWNEWKVECDPDDPDYGWEIWPDLTGADLTRTSLAGADLARANLSHATLRQADLQGVILTEADLSHTCLAFTNLFGADLERANLESASLSYANLSYANLAKADLCKADLAFANFTRSSLDGAHLACAWIQGTIFANLDLGSVVGLASVLHGGPSSIAIDTLYQSVGKIPDLFLRGAGVPDAFITYAKSLAGSVNEYYSLFISYSTKDQEFADRLYADLQAKGVRCWFFVIPIDELCKYQILLQHGQSVAIEYTSNLVLNWVG